MYYEKQSLFNLSSYFLIILLIGAFGIKVAEGPLEKYSNFNLNLWLNAIWGFIITILTVEYLYFYHVTKTPICQKLKMNT